ncbi:unnamed protein product [Darwinula stevensoni]|uniref:Uncharacterized protein n=1 Tax=Darwinula stevensoni TaxID=69355 RepID=A0A7R8X1X1_9CRUS|nr:unnamed protein product [Darwinula stevensoni]CAG0880812.1 unnamed protein product [Darwinula stevensoni]
MALLRKAAAREVLFERRLILGVTISAFIAFIIWLVALSTDYWFVLDVPGGGLSSNDTVANGVFLRSRSGIWRLCTTRLWLRNNTITVIGGAIFISISESLYSSYHDFFPPKAEIPKNPDIDENILDYSRTEATFSVIAVFIMVLALGFSVYTFKQTRYMYKRLAGSLHCLAACSLLVVLEVVKHSMIYEEKNFPNVHPPGCYSYYGYSYLLAWVTFIFYLLAGLTFFYCSRKRKREKAPDEDWAIEDEPHIIGR